MKIDFIVNPFYHVPYAVIRSKLSPGVSPYASVPKAVIRDDLKAGGNISREFNVFLTPQGIVVDLNA